MRQRALARTELASCIFHRLHRRYINPLKNVPEQQRSGFLIMASCCLMIETLEGFHTGKNEMPWGESEPTFRSFFERDKDLFPGLADASSDFYRNIRCGILHQAETKENYRIRLKGIKPFDKDSKTIFAENFLLALQNSLERYVSKLRIASAMDPIWINAIKKLNYL